MSGVEDMINKEVCIITSDGRNFVGVLKGFDQTVNIVLSQCHERLYHKDSAVEKVPLGLYIVRGDNIAAIGMVDAEKEASLDYNLIRGGDLKEVVH